MAEVTLDLLFELTKRVHDEQRALHNEMRRLAENQLLQARSLEGVRNSIGGLRDDLELMLRTEIGGQSSVRQFGLGLCRAKIPDQPRRLERPVGVGRSLCRVELLGLLCGLGVEHAGL